MLLFRYSVTHIHLSLTLHMCVCVVHTVNPLVMRKFGVWIVLISMLEIKGAFSEEYTTNKPDIVVSFCTELDQTGKEFILVTRYAPEDSTWNCQCNILTNHTWNGTYHYHRDNTGPCSTTLSINDGYINNNCSSQNLSQSFGSYSVTLTKNTPQNGVRVDFYIKGSELLNLKCKTNSNQVPTSTPYDRGIGTTFGHQSTTHNNQASIIVTVAAVGSAVVVIGIVIIIVVCYFRRRLIKMQQYVQSNTLSGQYDNSAAMHEVVVSRNNQIPQNSQSFMTNSSIGRTDAVTNQQSSSYYNIDDSVVNHSRENIQQSSEYVYTRNDPIPSTSQYDYIHETGI